MKRRYQTFLYDRPVIFGAHLIGIFGSLLVGNWVAAIWAVSSLFGIICAWYHADERERLEDELYERR